LSKKISALPAKSELVGTEQFEINDSGTSKRCTAQSIADLVIVEDSITALETKVSLSAAQILSLNSSPVQLVAAPGANKVVQVLSVLFKYTFVSAAYATNTTLQIKLGSDVYVAVGSVISETHTFWEGIIPFDFVSAADIANQPVTITVQTGNPTAGNSTLKVYLSYRIFDV
jgi:hypothetical protein